jgi:hypothetical protein
MKVIAIDNFNSESVSDILIAENLTLEQAVYIVNARNNGGGNYTSWYYRVVEDDYKLYVFQP